MHHVPAAEALDVGRGVHLLFEESVDVALALAEQLARMLVARLGLGPGGEAGEHHLLRRVLGVELRILREVRDLDPAAPGDRPGVHGLGPARMLASVLFPEPLRPTRPTFSPVRRVTVIPSRMTWGRRLCEDL